MRVVAGHGVKSEWFCFCGRQACELSILGRSPPGGEAPGSADLVMPVRLSVISKCTTLNLEQLLGSARSTFFSWHQPRLDLICQSRFQQVGVGCVAPSPSPPPHTHTLFLVGSPLACVAVSVPRGKPLGVAVSVLNPSFLHAAVSALLSAARSHHSPNLLFSGCSRRHFTNLVMGGNTVQGNTVQGTWHRRPSRLTIDDYIF